MKPQRISGAAFLRRVVFRPGDHPKDVILGLAEALTRGASAGGVGLPELLGPGQDASTLAAHVRTVVDTPGYVFAGALGRVTQEERQHGRVLAFEEAKLILVIDQLEELFTLPSISGEDRQRLLRLLAGLARSGAVWVVATLRTDFWHRAADMPDLMALAQGYGRLDIAAPAPAELAEMIRKPAQAAGLSFESHPETGIGLDAVLAEHAAAEPGVLPLLSFTLDELYRRDVTTGHGRVLTYATYEALGGLEGAIATRADQTVASLAPAAQTALPRVLRTLATVSTGADHAAVARAAPLDSFPPGSDARTVVEALTAARLLVAASAGTTPTVRFAHEALLSRWQRARDQLTTDRRDIETRALVEQQRIRWQQASGRTQRQLLLRGPDLANAVDLDRRWADELAADTRIFIQASRRRARRRRQVEVGASIVFGLIAAVAVYAQQQARVQRARAESATQEATVQAQEAQHRLRRLYVEQGRQEWLQGHPMRAVAYLSEAYQMGEAGPPFLFLLKQAMRTLDAQRAVLKHHQRPVVAVAFSPDGQHLTTASRDGIAQAWEATSGQRLAPLGSQVFVRAAVRRVVLSPDGQHLATVSDDEKARVWNGTILSHTILEGHRWPVEVMALSPDGQRLATAGGGAGQVWETASGQHLATLEDHQVHVRMMTFTPDGQRLATVSRFGTTKVWDALSGRLLATLVGSPPWVPVGAMAFSPDGQRLATGSGDGTARVWETPKDQPLATLEGHRGAVVAVAFSPDGQRLATGSRDGTARVWDAPEGWLLATFEGHRGAVEAVAFSPDGQHLATGSEDQTARVWEVPRGRLLAPLESHEGSVKGGVFSPDGQRRATVLANGTVWLWDVTNERFLDLKEHPGSVVAVTFSPDSQRLATTHKDGAVSVWEAMSGQFLGVAMPDSQTSWLKWAEPVKAVAFSPDGQRLATAGEDQMVRLWEATRRRPLSTLTLLTTLPGHRGAVEAVAFSPDGQHLATAGEDQTVRLWEVTSGQPLATLEGHRGNVRAVAFSPDGQRLTITHRDETARVWDVSPEIRSKEAIAELVRCKALWRFNEGRLLRADPDPTTCPPRSPAP